MSEDESKRVQSQVICRVTSNNSTSASEADVRFTVYVIQVKRFSKEKFRKKRSLILFKRLRLLIYLFEVYLCWLAPKVFRYL